MFCTKLKELQITGECPFSSGGKHNALGDLEERNTDSADAHPISKEVHGLKGEEDASRQRSIRAKVNLHTLGDSIRKLACPEVSLKKERAITYATLVFHLDLCRE